MFTKTAPFLFIVAALALGNTPYVMGCQTDKDCTSAAQPVCGPKNTCVECNSDRDCRGTLICTANNQCKKESGEAISACSCNGAARPKAILLVAPNCASGTRSMVACGGVCPDGNPPHQLVCN